MKFTPNQPIHHLNCFLFIQSIFFSNFKKIINWFSVSTPVDGCLSIQHNTHKISKYIYTHLRLRNDYILYVIRNEIPTYRIPFPSSSSPSSTSSLKLKTFFQFYLHVKSFLDLFFCLFYIHSLRFIWCTIEQFLYIHDITQIHVHNFHQSFNQAFNISNCKKLFVVLCIVRYEWMEIFCVVLIWPFKGRMLI